MKTNVLAALMLSIGFAPFPGKGAGTDYAVAWSAAHLNGTFTLDVPAQFGTYVSTDASGTYGGLSGTFSVVWTSVRLDAGPERTDLTFVWGQGYAGFGVTPAYVGRSSPWTSADQAWEDLRTKSADESRPCARNNLLQLRNADRIAYVRVVEALQTTGVPLELAALQFAEAWNQVLSKAPPGAIR